MSPMAIVKLLKTAKKIHEYVVEKNTLDHQMEMVLNRIEKLEKVSHPKRDFACCDCCKKKMKPKKTKRRKK